MSLAERRLASLLATPGLLRRRLTRAAVWVGVLSILGLIVQQGVSVGDFRIDDAYITFSFSKNLALGNGPVYSHGVRVEGYSNFLWMLLMVPAFLFAPGSDGYDWSRFLSLALLVYGLILSYRMARRGAGPVTALLAPLSLMVCTDWMRAALSGLETIPYAVAILFGWCVYLKEPPDRRRWSLLAFLPAALMRIDGFVPLLIVIGFEFLLSVFERRFSPGRFLAWLAPTALIWGGYFLWRYAYYGLPLPATYYAKTLVDLNEPNRAVDQLWDFLRDLGLLPMLLLMVPPIFRGPRRAALGLWTAIALYLVYVSLTGGDWMPFHRFFLPILPLGAVLAAWGAARLLQELRPVSWEARASGFLVLAAGLAFFGVHAHMASVDTQQERDKLGEAAHTLRHTRDNLLAGMDLAKWVIRRPGERLVTDYAGVFAVFTEASVIDMWGLCTIDIARFGGTEGINPIYGKECSRCYAWLGPDYFHPNVPLVRGVDAFRSQDQLIREIFQGQAIDRVIGLRRNFATGRVVETRTARSFWFLERRRDGVELVPREPAPGIRVDYPFEPNRG